MELIVNTSIWDPIKQTKLHSLMNISRGSREVSIGIIDGPIDFDHPAFKKARIRAVKDSQLSSCKRASSIACMHGTFVSGILCADRGLDAPAICPDCEVVLFPIFKENDPYSDIYLVAIPKSYLML
jgi:hypothetical protein